MSRFARRVDSNHAQIKQAFVYLGWKVEDLSRIGHGVPDLFCEKDPENRCVWVEVKDGAKKPSARKLTEDENFWHYMFRKCGVVVRVIENVDQVKQLDEERFGD